ncbi:hydroxyacyl-thioester dehydratase type 2, mitochondrial-like isoform X1 [Limulus polyphemus]|uniref:Hydroxyacyl-thioester dehydratase type 2, mitochondrial-like isoform X1 n=1 Tax=Limulus polyphemus TaxID=6850 RepID=A0ABM1BGC1_LIMPO|nr:hydroxyacyl-thioester dehydratase type 2, mitochondrial-like isoform X1 [Limulus polyphemus]
MALTNVHRLINQNFVKIFRGIKFCFSHESRSLKIGDTEQLSRVFTRKDVEMFAHLSGDTNPVHLDDCWAEKSRLGKRVVHGALLNGLISAVMGTKLPGFGCVVVKQTLEFPNPLYIDEEVTASVTLKSLRKALVVCDYSCITNDGKVVLRGEAKLVLPHNES